MKTNLSEAIAEVYRKRRVVMVQLNFPQNEDRDESTAVRDFFAVLGSPIYNNLVAQLADKRKLLPSDEPIMGSFGLTIPVDDGLWHLFLVLEDHPDSDPRLVARLLGSFAPPGHESKVREAVIRLAADWDDMVREKRGGQDLDPIQIP